MGTYKQNRNDRYRKMSRLEIGALNHSMKFLSPEIAPYLYKSTIDPAWNSVVMSGLVLLGATWNW